MSFLRGNNTSVPELEAGLQGHRHQGAAGHHIRNLLIRDSHEGIRPVPRNRFPGQGHLSHTPTAGRLPLQDTSPRRPRAADWDTNSTASSTATPGKQEPSPGGTPSAPRPPEDSGYRDRTTTIPPRSIPDWRKLAELWERDNILPTEEVPHGDDQRPHWTMGCPAGGTCSAPANF